MDKPRLRRQFCSVRECLAFEEVAAASAALCQRLANWIAVQQAQAVMTYLAFRSEPDLGLLFDLVPRIQWVVPRIQARDRSMVLHPFDRDHLIRHRFGMLEPAPDLPVVDPATLDLVLVPGVAFDRRGGRLGFGAGYYDHFLPTTSALRVGIAYDECLCDALPCGEHDQRMDWVVTPTQEVRCGERGGSGVSGSTVGRDA